MVAQTATHARCMFSAHQNWDACFAIMLNHVTNTVRIAAFTRAGLCSSPELNMKSKAGVTKLVRAIVGILSWTTPMQAGIDPTSNDSFFCLPKLGIFKVESILFRKFSLKGRATAVYHVVKYEQETGKDKSRSAIDGSHIEQITVGVGKVRNSKDVRQSTKHNPQDCDLIKPGVESLLLSAYCDGSINPGLEVPCVFKVSNVTKDVTDLGVFGSLGDKMGVVQVVDEYVVEVNGIKMSTNRFMPADATNWDKNALPHTPEHRNRQIVLMKTFGVPLDEASSPRVLLKAIMHAMLGHYILFSEGGYLHRDVSIGNILLLDPPEARDGYDKFDCTRGEMQCYGVICDGDLAVKWKDASRIHSQDRSGTLPFISIWLLQNWVMGRNECALHAALEDLESFVWVLVYVVLKIAKAKDKELGTNLENLFLDRLINCRTERQMMVEKSAFIIDIKQEQSRTRTVTAFVPLIRDWLDIAREAKSELSKLDSLGMLAKMEDHATDYFQRYYKAGLKALGPDSDNGSPSLLGDSWD